VSMPSTTPTMYAFWMLSLDLLRGNVERGLKKSGGMQRKQLR